MKTQYPTSLELLMLIRMEKPGFIVKFYDKSYEDLNIEELVNASVASISGVSEFDAADLRAH